MSRRWLRWLAALTLVPLAGALLTAYLFFERPEVVLTDWAVGAAVKRFGASYSPRWNSLSVHAGKLGRRRHRYSLRATDLCADEPNGAFSACFSEFELTVNVYYTRRGPVLERVERLVAVAAGARVDLRRLKAGGGRPWLRAVPVDALRVALAGFHLQSSSSSVTGDIRAVLAPGVRRPLSVAVDLRIQGASGPTRLKAEVTADTDLLKGGAGTYIDLLGRADLGAAGRARVSARVRREALRLIGAGSAEITLPAGPLRTVRFSACKGAAPVKPGASRPSAAAGSCRYELVLAKPAGGRLGEIKAVTGTVSLNGEVDGELFTAALAANLEPVKAWYELTGDLGVHVHGALDRPLREAAVTHELHAAVRVPRFEELVSVLRETKYAVPAPIHVLKGPLSLAVESHGDSQRDQQSLHYVFSSDLAAARERMIVRAAGDLTVADIKQNSRSYENAGDVQLSEVALELPRLEIGRAPKVFYDQRIRTEDMEPAAPRAPTEPAKAGRESLRLKSRLRVHTGKPMILFSNLTKTPIPVVISLGVDYPPVSVAGAVSLRAFDVELFRRNATVDHLNVALSSGSHVGVLEGLVRYRTPHTAVGILIMGTTEKPRIELTSAPPMKREDIIALLIFGKSPDELDPEQSASVGNTETALESRAFGLASLYLFGATPIEHVGYDSATKTASVKLRLPGGANLTLGSDFDKGRRLSLRQPLAPHWAIQSEVTDQAQQSRAAATFLEWFNRY